jgi:hypothetical protein
MIEILKILSGFGSVFGFLFWVYKKQPAIKLSLDYGSNGLLLSVSNIKDIDVEIKYIQLVRHAGLFKYELSDSLFGSLVDNSSSEAIMKSQHDEINCILKTNSAPITFNINYSNLFFLYDDFINWVYYPEVTSLKVLADPIKLPNCYIQAVTTSGKKAKINVPELFYDRYKKHIADQMNDDLMMLNPNSRQRYINASDSKAKLILDAYKAAVKTSYLMFR